MNNPLDKSNLANQLAALDEGDLLEVLQEVFAQKFPYPLEGEDLKGKYFLGVATPFVEVDTQAQDTEAPQLQPQTHWEIMAVSYVNRATYPVGNGDDFSQFGQCCTCRTPLCGNVKEVLCPICGSKEYLT